MNIYEKVNKIKKELSETEIKKSGHNKHLNFKYHELSDFLGVINTLNEKHGVNEHISVGIETSTLTLTNTEKPEETIVTSVPTVMADMQPKNDSIQKLGATLTYLRRYLYLQAYSITEHEIVDAQDLAETKGITQAENKTAVDKLKLYVETQLHDQHSRDIVVANTLAKHGFTKLSELDFNKVDKQLIFKSLNNEINKLKQEQYNKKDEELF